MSFFTNKNFLYKLIICLCIFLAIINFINPKIVYAEDESGMGGALIAPICDLLLGLGDAIMNILQNSVMGTYATTVIDNTKEIDLGGVLIGILVVALAVVAIIATAGGAAAALAAITPALVKGALIYGAIALVSSGQSVGVISAVAGEVFSNQVVLPTYTIGPEEIFSGRILLFDANIFNPKTVYVEYDVVDLESETIVSTGNTSSLENWNTLKADPQNKATRYYYMENGEKIDTSINNSAYELRDIISKWYYIIRNIALVGSMITLLYIGIRILITSIAEEKAKYKQMLSDWAIALCLIVLMHYIMIFSHSIVESLVTIFKEASDSKASFAVIQDPPEKLKNAVVELETERKTILL